MDANFTVPCTGDAVAGDIIQFTEAVFGGSVRKPKCLGERTVEAEIVKDSYGAAKQQHTFTLRVLACSGFDIIPTGQVIRRKGRNVYRNGTLRRPWPDESQRVAALNEKHERGNAARTQRDLRRQEAVLSVR